jgi:MOSC domain-containing protein
MSPKQDATGAVVSLWRYPVKSMMGEELYVTEVTQGGLVGDRAYGLIDSSDGKVVTAKNPRKWPEMFYFRAELVDVPHVGSTMPRVRIKLPDGTLVASDQADVNQVLSKSLKREVKLSSLASRRAGTSEEYWPDMEGLDHRDTVTDFGLPEGTFFDCAFLHLLTTSTIDRLRALYPEGRFEVRRFRPNIVVNAAGDEKGFVENGWIGRTLAIGDSVRLGITGPCPRCVMTTLAQGDLPKDMGILRTAVKHNQGGVGVYASVLQGGQVRRGDSMSLV